MIQCFNPYTQCSSKAGGTLTQSPDDELVHLPGLQRVPDSGVHCCPPPYSHSSEKHVVELVQRRTAKTSLSKTCDSLCPRSREVNRGLLENYSNIVKLGLRITCGVSAHQ